MQKKDQNKINPCPELASLYEIYSQEEIIEQIEDLLLRRVDYAHSEQLTLQTLSDDCYFLHHVKKFFQALAKKYSHGN